MNTRIVAKLDTKDLNRAIKELEDYTIKLQSRLVDFASELAEIGIRVAKENTYVEVDENYRNMGDFILFEKNITLEDGNVVCVLSAIGREFIKRWQNGEALVNPLLMAEFGSGWRAIEGHQGSFPNQHLAFFHPWHWIDSSGQPHESYGSEPSRPLFKAKQEMENEILEVAYRVFSQ